MALNQQSATMSVPQCLIYALLNLLVLCDIPFIHGGSNMDTAEVNIDPIPLESKMTSPVQTDGAKQDAISSSMDGETLRFHDPNLHPEHYPYYFNQHSDVAEGCRVDQSCPWKDQLGTSACWGYEDGCTPDNMPGYPILVKFLPGWFSSKEAQIKQFWLDVDFGYIKLILDDGWYPMCTSTKQNGASLSCIDKMHACVGKNLFLDFSRFDDASMNRGRFDIGYFQSPGRIGGQCDIDKELLKQHSTHFSELQSWYGELQQFTSVKTDPFGTSKCDVVVEGRTYLMKFDAGINMFHHFCDFVNLYITQHLLNDFSLNVTIVMWDMSYMRYLDLFEQTWPAFTNRPLIRLSDWAGKKVCLRDAVFTLPPRMIRGFFYNMPVIPGIHGSNLMRAFSQHVWHRLGIKQRRPGKNGKVRVTLLERKSTHRNIINQDELVQALKEDPNYDVRVVAYNYSIPFVQQIEQTHNSDIFLGMHGAGLTHALFLPDWAAIFEICNCEDKHCYEDLANLRGVHYLTWENDSLLKKHNEILHPSLKTYHAKFCDYSFNKAEFLRLVKKAYDHVINHPKFQQKAVLRDEL